jgi:hypothetical protein
MKDGVEPRLRVRRTVRVSSKTGQKNWSKLWAYSFADLADLFGISEAGVRRAIAQKRLDPDSIQSICRYWAAGAQRRTETTKLTAEAFIALRGHGTVEAWKRRWPHFDVYRCGSTSCREVLLEEGYCREHGGERPLVTLSDDDHFLVWLKRRYIPICQMIFGSNHAVQVQHLDGNTWNSHPDNLVLVGETEIRSKRSRWTYDYNTLGVLFDLSESAVRKAVSRRELRPESLSDVCSFLELRARRRTS